MMYICIYFFLLFIFSFLLSVTYIYIYRCMYISICMPDYLYTYRCMYIYIYMYAHTYICSYEYINTYIIYVYICICIYLMYIYMYIYIHSLFEIHKYIHMTYIHTCTSGWYMVVMIVEWGEGQRLSMTREFFVRSSFFWCSSVILRL